MFESELLSIVAPALAAGLLVAATHVPLGMEVLDRGIIFIDLAIAQLAALGVVMATMAYGAHGEPPLLVVQVAAVAMALSGALLFNWSGRRLAGFQEALIGSTFVLAASGALLLLANRPQGGEEIKDLLAGQILWVTWDEIALVAALYAVILGIWFGLRRRLGSFGFYSLFALTVTASVQLVGVYLVFASLILPALGCRGLARGRRLVAGYAVSATGLLGGVLVSVAGDLPTGPVLVWSLGAAALVFALVASRLPGGGGDGESG